MSANIQTAPQYDIAVSDDDGLDQPEVARAGMIQGRMLRFKNDDFMVDKTEYLPEGTQLVAVKAVMGWTKWSNKKPETRVTQRGQEHPYRHDLPDQDQSRWEKGLDGNKADPWRDTRWLYLLNPANAERFTFTSDTYGGLLAFGELKEAIRLYRKSNPGAMPVVKLTNADMPTKFGTKKRPKFEIVDWHHRKSEEPQPVAVSKPNADMDDDIPFAPEWR
jgi:hypothetical protein